MNRYRKLFSDTVILAFGTFGSKLLVFLLMPLYTALLSPAEYGTAELITSTANLIMPFACLGVTTGMFRFAAEQGRDQARVFSSGLALVGAGFGALLLVGLPLYAWGGLPLDVGLVILYVLSADLQAVCAQYIRALDRTRLFAWQGVFNTLLTILCNLLFLIAFGMGVTGYVLAVIVGNLCTTALLVVAGRLWRVFRPRLVSRETMRELFRFSLPMIPATICWLITDLSDRYFVTAICGEAANGIYAAAYKIPTIVNLASGIFMQAWQFSAVAQSADDGVCRRFYSEVFRGFLSLVFIGAAVLLLLSRFLCRLLLDSSYFEAWRYMPTLLCAAALEAVVSFLATVYLVKKKSMHSFLTAMAGAGLNLLLNALMIPGMGALGAAVATLIGYGAVYLLRMWDVPRLLRFGLCLPRQAVSIALLLALAAAMTIAPPGRLLWGGLLTLGISALNLPALVRGLRELLHSRRAG